MLNIKPSIQAPLDPGFQPAVLWNEAYQKYVAADPSARPLSIALEQRDGSVSVFKTRILSKTHPESGFTFTYIERLVKTLLWCRGGWRIHIGGDSELAKRLGQHYSPEGPRAFDNEVIGQKVYGQPLCFVSCAYEETPEDSSASSTLGGHLDGCRIGFDLGGSDRKCAAVKDGEVVFSEEVPWDPYFQSDPSYHIEGIHESLSRAAEHLPHVDAIGGSSAGIYINNEVRIASLFRGVSEADFEQHIRRIFFTLKQRWDGVPFEVANDGDVTALAGAMSLKDQAVLGVSMGTSQAGGYVNPQGQITTWLNELAFAPVDYQPNGPVDEWSGDYGCGVQYFSQQGVNRLALAAGFTFSDDMGLPARLERVQEAMAAGDQRAQRIFETIGVYFGYTIAWYAQLYTIRNLLFLGRVTSGQGGDLIRETATKVLQQAFPALAQSIRIVTPDEKQKRHGQAIAAASLPQIK